MENLVKINQPEDFWKRFIKSELATLEFNSVTQFSNLISAMERSIEKKYRYSINRITQSRILITFYNFVGDENYFRMLIGLYTGLIESVFIIERFNIFSKDDHRGFYVQYK